VGAAHACASARSWREAGLPMPVAVNLSARQFHDGRLVADIAGILAAAGLEPGDLELEITESTVMQNPDRAAETPLESRRWACTSIDDFGTGYSRSRGQKFPIGRKDHRSSATSPWIPTTPRSCPPSCDGAACASR
jgi:EAL domain-containing protein (putative c-di-GMP-specific phosphodiesterase class I)